MKPSRTLAACLVSIAISPAGAAPQNITAGELALLPAFCQDAQTFNGWEQYVRESPRAPYWISKMGRSFWDIHHFCWAGVHVLRAGQPGLQAQHRVTMLEAAIDDYAYIIRKAAPGMVLLPELYYRTGDLQRQLGQYGLAIESFNRSRTEKPDYWPPYVGHAEILLLSNQRAQAKAVLEDGLKLMPDEPALKSRLARLNPGGSGAAASSRAAKGAQVGRPAAAAKPASASQ